MNISKKIKKVEKSISKYILKRLKLPKLVKQFVAIHYCTYHSEIRIFYNGNIIGKVGSDEESLIYSTRELIEKIIKNHASELALSNLKEKGND